MGNQGNKDNHKSNRLKWVLAAGLIALLIAAVVAVMAARYLTKDPVASNTSPLMSRPMATRELRQRRRPRVKSGQLVKICGEPGQGHMVSWVALPRW